MAWTDDRVLKLRTMWADGHSASQIATALGGVTRNAVIGKVHRLGLSGRDRTGTGAAAKAAAKPKTPKAPRAPSAARKRTTAKAKAPRKANTARKAPPASKPLVEPASRARNVPSAPRIPQAVRDMAGRPFQAPKEAIKLADGSYATVLTITEHMCKWPLGDPGADDFRFCGRRTEEEEPYCTAHSRVAYQPSRRRSNSNKAIAPITRRKAIR
jgi:GcrA cell cycle regulator